MRVLHLTKTRVGGAGVAASRTVAALQGAGMEATLWTEGSAPALNPGTGTLRRWLLDKIDSLPTRLYWRGRRFSAWSNNWRRTGLAAEINRCGADLVHLHWIGQGFLSLDDLSELRVPVVWTLHDAWAFTGGCHYPGNCLRYYDGCGCCPQLASHSSDDLSARNHAWKRRAAAKVLHWITPSAWLADCAAHGGIIPRERLSVVPHALDERLWYPLDRAAAREILRLPNEALVLAAGAMDLREPRKGCQLLPKVVAGVAASVTRPVILLLFGKGGIGEHRDGYEIRSLGSLRVEREIAGVLSAADAVLMPSLQDNLPNVVMEAQACGCPVVGFRSGGIGEIVQEGRTGLLSRAMTAGGLTSAMLQWLQVAPPREEVIRLCRERQRKLYAPAVHAATLCQLYEEVLTGVSRP